MNSAAMIINLLLTKRFLGLLLIKRFLGVQGAIFQKSPLAAGGKPTGEA